MLFMYSLKKISDKNIWNSFIIKNIDFYSFLNSFERWLFQKKIWNNVFYFWIYDEADFLVWLLMLIKIKAKRWTYFLSPHFPIIKKSEKIVEVINDIKKNVISLAKKEKVDFRRIAPQIENSFENLKKYSDMKFIFAPIHVHTEETHLLDLSLTEEELLKNMRKTTRYLIKRAQKEWVNVYIDNSKKNIQRFIDLHHKHSKRTNWKANYVPFSEKYITTLFEVFDKDSIFLMNAEYDWNIEASLVSIKFWKTTVYYLWASDIKHPKFSPAYLLQWESIKNAKKYWSSIYNFRWVSPNNNKKHPLYWVSLFKRWFSWYDFNLLHAHDLPISRKYLITYWIESIRRIKRWYFYVKPQKK